MNNKNNRLRLLDEKERIVERIMIMIDEYENKCEYMILIVIVIVMVSVLFLSCFGS